MNYTLSIQDFKLFEKLEVHFRNLTVFAGINSVGKSSIIQGLLLLRTTIEEESKYEKGVDSFPVPLNGPFNMELGNTVQVIRRGKRISESAMKLQLVELNGSTFVEVEFLGDRADQNQYHLNATHRRFEGGFSGLLHHHFYYLCAERIGPRSKYEFQPLTFLHAGFRGENSFQILSGENIEVASNKAFRADEPGLMLNEARQWLEYIIPGAKFDNATALGRSRVIEGTFGESLPTNVGFGISYVLPIIVNGLLAEPGTFYVVENPEAHLHPLGQSRIGRFLAVIAGVGVNVVIETHSEHVINGIRISSLEGKINPSDILVNFVSKDDQGDSITEIEVTELGDLTAYPQGFFDQEQVDIARLIIEKRKKLQK